MTIFESENGQQSAISASWKRCERKHRLARNTLRPILRLQSSEVAPRREELVERTGGHLGIFRQIADIAVRSGHCFSVADADGILVRREGKDAQKSDYESNGIALGSCWDERIGGTNGVSMAMAQQRAFTVRGHEHYFSKFSPFACTGAPLRDAGNEMIGIVNLAIVDRGNAADYQFAQQLLGAAANRIQRVLFERRFGDTMLVTVSSPTSGDMLNNNELLAVDETGLILGSTAAAHRLVGLAGPTDLVGQSFEEMFGASVSALDRVPEQASCVPTGDGQVIRLSRRLKDGRSFPGQGWHPPSEQPPAHPQNRRPLSLQELASGSDSVIDQCNRAELYLNRAIPFVVQGASGTGKTALVAALHAAAAFEDDEILTVDCAVLGDADQDRAYVRTIFEQARIVGLLDSSGHRHLTLVFDNIQEMPGYAQAALRSLLQEGEAARDAPTEAASRPGVAVIATTRRRLAHAVRVGSFREDLYYLLANTVIALPPLPKREKLDALVQSLAARLAGRKVEITPEAMQAIQSYHWPGNVRELRSTLRQALMEGDGHRISLIDLASSPLFEQGAHRSFSDALPEQPMRELPYDERTQILDALIGARWNVSQAARKLGIGRATIHRKMKRLGISRPS